MKCYLSADREEIDQAHALSASLADVQRQGHISVIDRQLMMSASAAASTDTSAPATKYQGRPEDFPTLDGMPQPTTAEEPQHPKPSTTEKPDANPAPRAGMSLAKKLAISNRFSVRNGPMDSSDFPSLANGRATKSRKGPPVSEKDFPSLSHASKAEHSKASAGSVWNAADKSSTDEVWPSNSAGKSGDLRPRKSDDDFPSLKSVIAATEKSSLPASSLPVKSLTSISRNFSSSSLSKLSDQTDRADWPLNHAGKSEDLRPRESDDDFPSLISMTAATEKSSSLPANSLAVKSLSTISRNFSSGSLSKLSDKADKASNPPSQSSGPELNHESDKPNTKEPKVRDNLLRMKMSKKSGKSWGEAWGDDGGRQTDETSDRLKPGAASSNGAGKPTASSVEVAVATPVETTTGEDDGRANDASTADSPRWTHVGGEKKTQSKPSRKNDAKPQTDKANSEQAESRKAAKSGKLAKSQDGISQLKSDKDKSTNGKDNSNKNKKKSKAQTAEKNGVNGDAKQSVELHAEKKSGAESDLPKLSETLEAVVDGSATSIEKQASGDDACRSSALNSEVSETVRVVDNKPTFSVTQSSGTTYVATTAVPVFNSDDFPSLVPQLSLSSVPSLPPGFASLPVVSSSKPPPPGFSNPVLSQCTLPGLNSLVSSAVVSEVDKAGETGGMDSNLQTTVYIPPRDMQQRSARLVGFIGSAVKDGSFGEFRELSAKFRAGSISAGEYHGGCRDIMDSTEFLSIFPELIALLPDLPKQNQLLKVHRDFLSKTRHLEKTRSWCTTPDDGLVSCVVCSQVLRHSDLSDHSLEHGTFNADYPTLPDVSLCSVR